MGKEETHPDDSNRDGAIDGRDKQPCFEIRIYQAGQTEQSRNQHRKTPKLNRDC